MIVVLSIKGGPQEMWTIVANSIAQLHQVNMYVIFIRAIVMIALKSLHRRNRPMVRGYFPQVSRPQHYDDK